jgi:hypothetical protein
MAALALTSAGLAGIKSPNTVLVFLSVDILMVGLPAALLWKPSNSFGMVICVGSLWLTVTLPIAFALVICVQSHAAHNPWLPIEPDPPEPK